MNILITNDDGIESPSLMLLFKKLNLLGNVFVVVPDREMSGSSHSITLTRPLRLKKIEKNIYTLDGTPADCVSTTLLGGLNIKKIDLVISGVNKGPNLSEDVFYSGTVAGAREGALSGIPAISISLDSLDDNSDFSFSVQFLFDFLKKNDIQSLPLLNINIPNLKSNEIKGFKLTHLGQRRYRDVLIKRKDPWDNSYFWLKGQGIDYKKESNSDYNELKNGYVSITPLNLDLTHYNILEKLKKDLVI